MVFHLRWIEFWFDQRRHRAVGDRFHMILVGRVKQQVVDLLQVAPFKSRCGELVLDGKR